MTENEKRFRIEFTVDAEGWSDKFIKDSAIQELTCMVPYPEDITFSEVSNPWHTGTPTEEGWYLIQTKRVDVDTGRYIFKVGNLSDVLWFQNEGYKELSCYGIVAWQKIEPYKENEDGRTD